jgi:hypothetical protein
VGRPLDLLRPARGHRRVGRGAHRGRTCGARAGRGHASGTAAGDPARWPRTRRVADLEHIAQPLGRRDPRPGHMTYRQHTGTVSYGIPVGRFWGGATGTPRGRADQGLLNLSSTSATLRRKSGGTVSDRVTWEACPRCGRTAALGWVDEHPVEFDCTTGCRHERRLLRRVIG